MVVHRFLMFFLGCLAQKQPIPNAEIILKSFINLLILICPQSAAKGSTEGLPLHFFCINNGTDIEILDALLSAHPEATSVVNLQGIYTAEHVVIQLLKASPPSLSFFLPPLIILLFIRQILIQSINQSSNIFINQSTNLQYQ